MEMWQGAESSISTGILVGQFFSLELGQDLANGVVRDPAFFAGDVVQGLLQRLQPGKISSCVQSWLLHQDLWRVGLKSPVRANESRQGHEAAGVVGVNALSEVRSIWFQSC